MMTTIRHLCQKQGPDINCGDVFAVPCKQFSEVPSNPNSGKLDASLTPREHQDHFSDKGPMLEFHIGLVHMSIPNLEGNEDTRGNISLG